jgi:hypothetical protein
MKKKKTYQAILGASRIKRRKTFPQSPSFHLFHFSIPTNFNFPSRFSLFYTVEREGNRLRAKYKKRLKEIDN